MSDILGMTATEAALSRENSRLRAMLKSYQYAEKGYSAAFDPNVMQVKVFTPQLNIAVETKLKDDGMGYHVIANAYSGLRTAYYVDRTALMRLSNWAIADMMKQQLESVTCALVAAVTKENGLPNFAMNLDESDSAAQNETKP